MHLEILAMISLSPVLPLSEPPPASHLSKKTKIRYREEKSDHHIRVISIGMVMMLGILFSGTPSTSLFVSHASTCITGLKFRARPYCTCAHVLYAMYPCSLALLLGISSNLIKLRLDAVLSCLNSGCRHQYDHRCRHGSDQPRPTPAWPGHHNRDKHDQHQDTIHYEVCTIHPEVQPYL